MINVDRGYVHAPDQVEWVPGIFALCRDALAGGYLPVVATNQAGIARGLYDERTFLGFTAWMHSEFERRGAPLLATYYCPHHPSAGVAPYRRDCRCRKPGPDMLLRAARAFDLDLAGSALVGDNDSDLQAAAAAGVGRKWRFGGGALPGFASVFDRMPEFQQ